MSIWTDWQAARARRQRVELYLNQVLRDVDTAVVPGLVTAADSEKVVQREIAFARRAIGLIVAERDALDDQTAADVSHQLAPVVSAESRRDPETGRLWAERWRGYTAALAARGSQETPVMRLARVMLDGAGVSNPSAELLQQATRFVQETRGALNESLRTAFGAASLPEDVRPSALRS